MFGGFILHFLLSNYLTVLLRPRYEEAVETAADLIKRNLNPFVWPGGEIFKQVFAGSSDPVYQEISQRLLPKIGMNILTCWAKWPPQSTGLFAQIGTIPEDVPEEEFKDWYRSFETIAGLYQYQIHLINKKWPLKKVLRSCINKIDLCHVTFRNIIIRIFLHR